MQKIEHDSPFYHQLLRLVENKHYQPHSLLGLHSLPEGEKMIRLWRPGAQEVYFELFGEIVQAECMDAAGLFEWKVPSHTTLHDYRVYHQDGLLAHDPYGFSPTFGELDQYLFAKGVHYDLYRCMGGRLAIHQGVEGARFAVWAPNAKSVSLVGNFNYWNGKANPMRALGCSGVWEIFIPGLQEGCKYKFEIQTEAGECRLKTDPYALAYELRPATAAILAPLEHFAWSDSAWLEERKRRKNHSSPMNVYEVHLGSWKKRGDHFLNYRELATALAEYCQEMGYNYIELMPIQEHPLDESWGYQVSGFYAPTSRYGTPEDFRYFINHLHEKGIGVLLDWVPGHFPTDDFSLGRYDGSSLYEHEDTRQGYHPHWHTHIFNFGRHEVSNFLIANALFWFETMHVDGLRVDAVASMLYLDYGRSEGEWIPNPYGGKENLEAIEFLKHLNSIVHERCPGILMIAEESTSFTGVTHPMEQGGLGFDLKWNMGWMNDTLRYFSKDMIFRSYHHHDLTFGLIYAFSERFILVFSHDEVVHGKQNLLSKMPGDLWQRFANLRLLFSYMICQPGKKLTFMGGEIGQWDEWNCKQEIQWFLLHYQTHKEMHRLVRELNHFYLAHAALWERDFHYQTFEWVNFKDTHNSVISYLRKGSQETLLCLHNFTPSYHPEYLIYFGPVERVEEMFNTDRVEYGGSGKVDQPVEVIRNEGGKGIGLRLSVSPLATMIFRVFP